jgi:hypothetical protein
MKKTKSNKVDNVRLFASAYLTAVARNLQYIEQIKKYESQIKLLESSNFINEPDKRKHLISLRMYTNPKEQVYDFTDIIQLIQFNSAELLVKTLREVHHNYSVMNINEMASALNKHEFTLGSYSDSISNELYILKSLADAIEAIREMPASR